jgi:hypothetical protein
MVFCTTLINDCFVDAGRGFNLQAPTMGRRNRNTLSEDERKHYLHMLKSRGAVTKRDRNISDQESESEYEERRRGKRPQLDYTRRERGTKRTRSF